MLEALTSLKDDKALSPVGFPMKFFKDFWEVVGDDVMNAFWALNKSVLGVEV